MTVRRAVRVLSQLSLGDVALLAEAQLAVFAAQMVVGRRPVGQLIAVGPTKTSSVGILPSDWRTATRVGLSVSRVARFGITRPLCLVRSLALQRMLLRRGIASDLRIGTRLANSTLEAHAWVELGGRVIGDLPQHVETFAPVTDGRLVQL